MYTHSLKKRTEFITVIIPGSGAAHEYSNAEHTCMVWGRIGLDSVIYRRDCIVSLWYVQHELAVCSDFGQPSFRMTASCIYIF